jgi:hypothetical protein
MARAKIEFSVPNWNLMAPGDGRAAYGSVGRATPTCNGAPNAMAKQPTKPQLHSWSIYRLRGIPELVGTVHAEPDEQAAIKRAFVEFEIPANQRDRLVPRRLD